MKYLNGYKTYIVAIATLLYAITGWYTGHIDPLTAQQMILASLGLSALRHAIANPPTS